MLHIFNNYMSLKQLTGVIHFERNDNNYYLLILTRIVYDIRWVLYISTIKL